MVPPFSLRLLIVTWMLRYLSGIAANIGSGFALSLLQEASRSRSIPELKSLRIDLVKSTQPKLSVIVPTFNEAPLIRSFLQHLRDRLPEAEIIVADGESTDGTADLSVGYCDQLVRSRTNRAIQMNAGASAAHGEGFWFLHVDAEVPWGSLNEIQQIMSDPKVAGGFFRIRLPRCFVYRLTDSFGHYAGILLRMRCGDHAIFSRRTVFVDVGGFPEVPLMEDVEFFRLIRLQGRVICSRKRIMVSPRRYETIGRLRLTLAYGLIAALYFFGVPLEKLASIYERRCCKRCSTDFSG
jgi:rSAM/selenodomain-associated transferase 2